MGILDGVTTNPSLVAKVRSIFQRRDPSRSATSWVLEKLANDWEKANLKDLQKALG